MIRRLAAVAALAVTFLNPLPARAEAAFTFEGLAMQACYGCGENPGRITGTLTGVVSGHTYNRAPLTLDYSASEAGGQPLCSFTGIMSGTMTVDDGIRAESWNVNATRSYFYVYAMSLSGSNSSGAAVMTFVPVSPSPLACQTAIVADVRGAGAVT